MTIEAFLKAHTAQLLSAGIESARLDCLILLEDVLGKDRAWILAHPEIDLANEQLDQLEKYIQRRTNQEPLAYIRNKAAFYGREFYVDEHVLVPRPESESFIELLKNQDLNTNNTQILDLGAGSGCIGISLALELPHTHVTLVDTDVSALAVAQKNTELLGVKAAFATSNLLDNINTQFDVIATNLPYVPNNYPVNKPTSFEPKLALFAGEDGLDLYRTFWLQVPKLPTPPAIVLTESLLGQHDEQKKLAEAAGYKLDETQGLVQLFKLS